MAMTLHALADGLAFQHVERRKQRRNAVTLVVVGHGAGASLLHRQPRLGAVQRLDLAFLFLSTESTMAWSGGSTSSPTTSLSLVANYGSLDSLNRRTRCGRRP